MSCIPGIFHEVQFGMTNFKATKIFILIDPLRMPEQKEKKKEKNKFSSTK